MRIARASRLAGAVGLLAAAGGCAPFNEAAGTFAGIETVVMLPVFGRTSTDLLYSLVAGRDCSIVRLEQGKRYCAPREAPPAPPLFCTRSLGVVDCWANPALLPDHPTPVADAPALTPAQNADRLARWPNL